MIESEQMEMHEIIKDIRLEMGLSQQALARELHVSFAAVNRWENQRTKPTKIALHALIELAKKTNVGKDIVKQLEMFEFKDSKGAE